MREDWEETVKAKRSIKVVFESDCRVNKSHFKLIFRINSVRAPC